MGVPIVTLSRSTTKPGVVHLQLEFTKIVQKEGHDILDEVKIIIQRVYLSTVASQSLEPLKTVLFSQAKALRLWQ